jgi:hypothetical protein
VGLVSAGEDALWGVLSLVGGGGRVEVLFWDVSGTNGVAVAGCLLYFAPTPTGSGFGWWHTDNRGGWYIGVVAVLRFPLLDRP